MASQQPEFETAIVWFRRDLRVDDNPALLAALQAATNVVPVFIWAPEEEGQFQNGRCSRWWTKHSLADLQQALAALGSKLIVRRSTDSTRELLAVAKECNASAVFFNHLYDPISLMRDHDVKRALTGASIAFKTFNGDMLYEPWEVLDEEKQPVSTFDAFWSRVLNMSYPPPFPAAAPVVMPPVPAGVTSLAVSEVDWFFTAEQEASSEQLKFKWKPGVGGAINELEDFLAKRLFTFEHDRAKVDRDSTSRLSPWIHIGSISVRYIFYRVRQCQAQWLAAGEDRSQSCHDFLQQMGYREYGRYLSFHFPFIHERSLLSHLRACPWRLDQVTFKAWRQGQTGYPIVDAAMRQLWSTGWCHNRGRVVAASFLVKNLLLPWQWGLKHFWDSQIDADLECDSLGWQYVSGGMSDAHPFSYMMDLDKEAKRFDPDGEYVRRWLPVLARLPNNHIHAPWDAPPEVLAAADVELGCNYPMPIITQQEAKANVEYACSVLDRCQAAAAANSSDVGSGRNPYRLPTDPANISSNPTNGKASGTPAETATGSAGAAAGRGGMTNAPQSRAPGDVKNAGSGGSPRLTAGPGSGSRRKSPDNTAGGLSGSRIMAPPARASGRDVFYLPGDSAGHAMLEQILKQQRQTRALGSARHIAESGTDNPQEQQQQQRYPQPPPAPGADEAARVAARRAAAAPDNLHPGVDASMLQQQMQMLVEGAEDSGMDDIELVPAAIAAYKALLRRRRVGVDDVSAIGVPGKRRAREPEDDDDEALDEEDSEEVVSNTVGLDQTAFTGASGLRGGTARGAQAQQRAERAAAAKKKATAAAAPGGAVPTVSGMTVPDDQAWERQQKEREREVDDASGRPPARKVGRHREEAEDEQRFSYEVMSDPMEDDEEGEAGAQEGSSGGGDGAGGTEGGAPAAMQQQQARSPPAMATAFVKAGRGGSVSPRAAVKRAEGDVDMMEATALPLGDNSGMDALLQHKRRRSREVSGSTSPVTQSP